MVEVAEAMDLALHPWQRLVGDVSGELVRRKRGRPGSRLRLAASNVGVLCGRQVGKTTYVAVRVATQALLPDLASAAALVGGEIRPQRIAMTAQDRSAALTFWREHVDMIMSSPLREWVRRPVLQRGEERLEFVNGSVYRVITPRRGGGRGLSLDLAVIDEARAHPQDLLGAIRPTLSARDTAVGSIGSQLVIVSNAGDVRSTLLNQAAELGRAAALRDDVSRVWLEWSCGPDDDPLDEAVWWATIPTLGRAGGPSIEFLRVEAQTLGAEAFAAEYLCRTVAHEPDAVIDPAVWEGLPVVELTPGCELVVAVDATPEGTSASVVAAGLVDGVVAVEVVEHRAGTDWLAPYLCALLTRWPGPVVVDGFGPAAATIPYLRDLPGVELVIVGARQVVEAALVFADLVTVGRVGHVDDYRFTDAVAGVTRRKVGDRWAFDRRGGTDISPIVAASLAAWSVETRPAVVPAIH